MSFDVTGILYQGVDTTSGKATPDWTVAANQPIITPVVSSMRGNGVTLSSFSWKYLGNTLSFTGAASGDWRTDSTGKFMMNLSTGALKIVDNLASTTNIANDTLEFSCTATVAGVEYSVSKSIDVVIQSIGSSSYMGIITATASQLNETTTTTTLTAKLLLSGEEIAGYYVKWYKDNEVWVDKTTVKTVTAGRDDVDGSQLFICEFYATSSDTTPVYRAGINIIDTMDDYIINLAITSTNKEVDTNNPVTVTATVINARSNSAVSISNPTWLLSVMSKDNWEVLKTSSTNSIVVTTAETDRNGVESDVEVIAEVSWN
jgi:hypothetical protein